MRVLIYQIPARWAGKTVEAFLRGGQGFSSRILSDLKKSDTGMLCNGTHIRSVDWLKEGDVLRLELPEETGNLVPSAIRVPIVYEDEDLIVFDKPAGMPCHPSRRYQQDTLANVYAAGWLEQHGTGAETPVFRPINRLDRNTTGLVITAKNPYAASKLGCRLPYPGKTGDSGAVEDGSRIEKMYLAIAAGRFEETEGEIERPIRRLNDRGTIRIVPEDGEGQYALTRYRVLSQGNGAALLQVQIKTGRTHQIRVHLSYIGHPLLGDDLYGGEQQLTQVQMLRCCQLSFCHPVSGAPVFLSVPFEPELARVSHAVGIPFEEAVCGMKKDLFTQTTPDAPEKFK